MKRLRSFAKNMSQTRNNLHLGKIILKNFQTYYGLITIELSKDADKPITIIHGEMGKGKTTLLNAIYWCLYGNIRSGDSQNTDESIISNDALSSLNINESDETYVEIYLYEEDELRYKIKRDVKFTKNKESVESKYNEEINGRISHGIGLATTMEFSHRPKRPGRDDWEIYTDQNRAQEFIENIFPEPLSSYFLFDAELLESFFNDAGRTHNVKIGIERISGLPIIDNVIEHLNKTSQSILNQTKDVNIEPVKEQIFALEQAIDNEKKIIAEEQKNVEDFNIELERIDEYLRNHNEDAINKDQERRDEIRKDLKNIRDEATKQEKEFADWLLVTNTQVRLKDSIEKSLAKCEMWEKEGKIPIAVSSQALQNILKSKMCICGTHLTEGSKERSHMEHLLTQNVADSPIIQSITTGRGRWEDIINSHEGLANKLKEERAKRDKINSEYEEQNFRLKELNKKLEQHDNKKIQEMAYRRTELDQQKTESTGKIAVEKHNQERHEALLQSEKSKLNILLEKNDKYESQLNRIKLADALSKIFVKCREELVDELRDKVAEKTTEYFMRLVPRLDISGVEIKNDYSTSVKDKNKNNKQLSAGQKCCLALSYIAAIREIAEKNYFMMIDSPLHNISAEERRDIAENLPKFTPQTQITLLVQDQEYTGTAKKQITGEEIPSVRKILLNNNYLWKEYLLKHTEHGNSYHTKVEEAES